MISSCEDQESDEDEQIDWEEVDVDLHNLHSNVAEDPPRQVAFDIVLSKAGDQSSVKKRSANSALERQIRHQVHRTHTISLLVAGLLRNRLLNDALLKARLLSLLPLPIINAFNHFSPETHPLARDRSRLFDSALKDLISWWWQKFQVNDSFKAMISRSWNDAEQLYRLGNDADGTSKATENTREDAFIQLLESDEPIHSVKSLMKRALLMKGSRDMSAQLFTSCLRALNIPARLVFSLQPVTWRAAGAGGKSANPSTQKQKGGASDALTKAAKNEHKPQSVAAAKSKLKPKHAAMTTKALKTAKAIKAKSVRIDNQIQVSSEAGNEVNEEDDQVDNSLSSTINYAETSKQCSSRQVPVKLRKSRPVKPSNWTKSPSPEPYEMNKPPVFWTEVYSRPLKEWYCVDVTRKRMRCKNIMEPSKNNSENKMIYVIAYEEDNFIRDVTARYAHSFGATTMKARLPSKKNETDWFECAAALLKRPYKLGRDVEEDMELEKARVTEAMPTTVTGFKNHPKYALERHLRREEVIHPKEPIGTFRGDNVYSRSSVVVCKTAENYMREGKRIKGGENPLKMVKPRTVTINRKRETELLKMDGLEVPLQGLFAEWQTELLIPPPIVDGIIPRNAYGNFDLFAPHMLPIGAKHLPYKGIAKIAKKLRVSYAEAVVSFEFHRSRATAVIDGIIVPELEAEFVLDAYWSSEEALEDRERQKLEERCLKKWKKLIVGLRIRHRLHQDYGNHTSGDLQSQKPVEGISQLLQTDLEREDTLETQKTTRVTSGLGIESRKVAFELYADHQMNPMRMTQPEDQMSKPSDLEEKPSMVFLASSHSSPDEVLESSNKWPSNRIEKPGVSIVGSIKSTKIKQKEPSFEKGNEQPSKEVDKIIDVPKRKLEPTSASSSTKKDCINSSPLTPPPPPSSLETDKSLDSSPQVVVYPPPKRLRIESSKPKKQTPPSDQQKVSKLKPNNNNNQRKNAPSRSSKSTASTTTTSTHVVKRTLRPRK